MYGGRGQEGEGQRERDLLQSCLSRNLSTSHLSIAVECIMRVNAAKQPAKLCELDQLLKALGICK